MSGVNEQQRDYVLRTVEERGIRLVRLWFTDVLGNLKSFAISPAEMENAMKLRFPLSHRARYQRPGEKNHQGQIIKDAV